MDSNALMPPGLVVHGSPDEIADDFAAIALLQPVRATSNGVICAPRAAPELAAGGLRACVLRISTLQEPPAWPDPPSQTVSNWYIKSPDHMPAPRGFDELIQVPGEGFGAWPHPTTLQCLAALRSLPGGAAIDLGCGSGLLSQAWASTRGQVTAIDLDNRAIAHARASITHAGLADRVTFHCGPLRRWLPASPGTVLLANVPPIAHREIVDTIIPGGQTLLISGIRADGGAPILAAYANLGFRVIRTTDSGGWGCWVLAPDSAPGTHRRAHRSFTNNGNDHR